MNKRIAKKWAKYMGKRGKRRLGHMYRAYRYASCAGIVFPREGGYAFSEIMS